MVDKTCSLLHYPRTKIHIQWGSREDRKPAIAEIAGFAFADALEAKSAMLAGMSLRMSAAAKAHGPCEA